MTSEGTVTRELIYDGRFIKETVKAGSDWGEYSGTGFIGYNNMTGVYEMVWVDSMNTGVHSETAYFDTVTGKLMSFGKHQDPTNGHYVHSWGSLDLSSPDRHTYEGYTIDDSGHEFKSFEGVMERVK